METLALARPYVDPVAVPERLPSERDIRFAQTLAAHLQDTVAGLISVVRNARIHHEVRAMAHRLGRALASYSSPLVDRLRELGADQRENRWLRPWTLRDCLQIGDPCPGRTGRCGPSALDYWDTHLRDALALCLEQANARPGGEAGRFAHRLSRELSRQLDEVRTLRGSF
ncbi:hypothetical protein [Demequina sp. NBRC 110057]|uniref:hypothetical protein n=1 Tax=Demequina sp. NBRC 110057 TaxID=1570346 RepID=UPI0009FFFACB|nr:hypothetical protein [Demequina sp. NBRC 110057]